MIDNPKRNRIKETIKTFQGSHLEEFERKMFNYLEVMMQIYYVSNNSKELERTSKNHAEPDEILEKYQRIIEHQKQKTRNCSIISD